VMSDRVVRLLGPTELWPADKAFIMDKASCRNSGRFAGSVATVQSVVTTCDC